MAKCSLEAAQHCTEGWVSWQHARTHWHGVGNIQALPEPGVGAPYRSPSSSAAEEPKAATRVLLELLEVHAQHFVMCLGQSESGQAAVGSSQHGTRAVPGGSHECILTSQALISFPVCTISLAHTGKCLLPPFLCIMALQRWVPS